VEVSVGKKGLVIEEEKIPIDIRIGLGLKMCKSQS